MKISVTMPLSILFCAYPMNVPQRGPSSVGSMTMS